MKGGELIMKNKIMAIVLTGVMLMPTLAYAKGQNEAPKGKTEVKAQSQSTSLKTEENTKAQENKAKAQENKAENKAAIEEFKAQIKAKHEIMKANTQKSIALKKQISSKKQEIALILADIKAGKKTLSPEQLDLLTAKADIVKETVATVKTLPTINPDVDNTQQKIKGKNFEAALSSLDKVIAKQEARYAKLVELNTNMDALLAIARQAQPVTTDVQTSTDTTNTNTSDTTANAQ